MIYLQLFLSFFQIGLFSFGGGYAAMPLIHTLTMGVQAKMATIKNRKLLLRAQRLFRNPIL